MTQTIDINDERAIRLNKLEELRSQGVDTYPALTDEHISLAQALTAEIDAPLSVVGRIMLKRDMGKITFCQLQDASGKMQIVLEKETVGEEKYKTFLKFIDGGDIIQVAGKKFLTKKQEPSDLVNTWTLLSKALLPLPDKFHGLQDEEVRLRKRYLEMIMDPELRQLFVRRSRFWKTTREFLLNQGFLEVETPVLETTAGGADATPFQTHHNALDLDLYLRISMGELWQKRLMVAGFEKTFEIGRQFRNEGLSREHLQDYSQMEFYWAFADYQKGMTLVESLYKEIVKQTYGRTKFEINNFTDIEFDQPWPRIDYVETIKEMTGLDVLKASDRELIEKLKELKIDFEAKQGRGRLVDSLWKHCRHQIKGPCFLVHVPVAVSPLAKRLPEQPELTQRFQVIIAGSELGNGYSELNDPLDQAERFREQARLRAAGDTEAQMNDTEFVEALEYGMPPTCGFGFSERLFSFLENRPIKECQLFPLVKPKQN